MLAAFMKFSIMTAMLEEALSKKLRELTEIGQVSGWHHILFSIQAYRIKLT
jgi:hypothetical protein